MSEREYPEFGSRRRARPIRLVALTAVILGALVAGGAAYAGTPGASSLGTGQWLVAGNDLNDSHFQAAEWQISPANASTLAPKWTVTTAGNVTATPTVSGGIVYVPDMGGMLWAVQASTGHVLWSNPIADYTGVPGDVSRTSPAIDGNELITGDGWISNAVTGRAHVFAVDRRTGQPLWSTQVDSHIASTITSSPVVFAGVVYVGIASKEEPLSINPSYPCCTARGAIVALNAHTGKILWKTYTVPSNNGGDDSNLPGYYSGGAVWGSSPVVDPRRGLLYIGTGNNYTVPDGVCIEQGQTGCTPPDPADHIDSILALHLSNGQIAWADRTLDNDDFSGACLTCGPDFDFGSAANLFTTTNPNTGQPEQLLGIGQKSGAYWALNPDNGAIVWHTQLGPGGFVGGLEWGSATDGQHIYVAEADSSRQPYTLGGSGPFAGQTVTSGSWAALDAATGQILWQTPDPQGATDPGYVSAANGVVYAGSTARAGANMYALDAHTGAILWSFASGGSVESGAAIVDGTVYWGSGYAPGNNNKLYAFSPTPSGQ